MLMLLETISERLQGVWSFLRRLVHAEVRGLLLQDRPHDSPAKMADLMFDVLCVVAACSASRCSRLQRVQRRAVGALYELLYVCTCCTRWASHVVSNVL